MATVNFLYRSTKQKAPLNVRLLFRNNEEDHVVGGKTNLLVTKEYWKSQHLKSKIKDIEIRNLQTEVKTELANIEAHILTAFNNEVQPHKIHKDWLKGVIKNYYHPPESKPEIPKGLVGYIDFYLDYRKHEISESGRKRIKVTQNKMEKLESHLKREILIEEINEEFKHNYVNYCNDQHYSQNTQQRELVLIKTICFHARHLGLKTHYQLEGLKLNRQTVAHIYLDFEELEKIKNLTLPHDYLENARDWLLISCFTGQRVSDFMRFTPEMIRTENERELIEFKQKKTKKLMTIPLLKQVKDVINKRKGQFPRPISEQRYNEYIKTVCELSGINAQVEGKKRTCIAPEGVKPTRNDYRDIIGTFEKWELVTSHIGRRSFATNFYGKVPTTYLINITGHSTEKMFLNYIKKSNKDLALDSFNYFD